MTEQKETDLLRSALLSAEFQMLPSEIADSVHPSRRAFRLVLWGIALSLLTFSFWALNLIAPAIGSVLMVLGFRMLRNENKDFFLCFVLSILRCLYQLFLLAIHTTIFAESFFTGTLPGKALSVLYLLTPIALLLFFWKGLRAVRQKAGIDPGGKSVLLLLLWYGAFLILALLQTNSPLIVLAMIALYPILLLCIRRVASELFNAGYTFTPAPVKLPAAVLCILLSAAVLCSGAIGYRFGGRYPMKWETADTGSSGAIRTKLLALGYPEKLLNDFSDEDLLPAASAQSLRIIEQRFESNTRSPYDPQSNPGTLRLSCAAVKLAGDAGKPEYLLLQHFSWEHDPDYFGTEAICAFACIDSQEPSLQISGEIRGKLLYDTPSNATFASPFFSIETVREGAGDKAYAAFSFPKEGIRRRGYLVICVSGEALENFPGFALNLQYSRAYTPIQYPVSTAIDDLKKGNGVFGSNAFDIFHFSMIYREENE